MSDTIQELVDGVQALSGRLQEVVLQNEAMARATATAATPSGIQASSVDDLRERLGHLQAVAVASREQLDAEMGEVEAAFGGLVRAVAEARERMDRDAQTARERVQALKATAEQQRTRVEASASASHAAVVRAHQSLESGRDHVADGLGHARDGATDLHQQTDEHRTALAAAAQHLSETTHASGEDVQHAVTSMVQNLAQHALEHSAEIHTVQEALLHDGHELQAALTAFIDALMRPALDAAIVAIRETFAHFIDKMGKGHGELAALRTAIEPLFNELRDLIEEVEVAAGKAQQAADDRGDG